MKTRAIISSFALLCFFLLPEVSVAQDSESFQDSFLRHFNSSSRKFMALAEAMPADKYGWRPSEGAMSVELVYMHIARYNYNYLHTYLGAALPEGIDLDTMEEITGKEEVLKHMKASMDYVRKMTKQMGSGGMTKETRLYGRDMEGWGVFFQLITHMNEHLGQSIAYARTNDITPPWSR